METKQLYKMLNMVKEFYEVFDQEITCLMADMQIKIEKN